MTKIQLPLHQQMPFASNPPIAELAPERILTNDVTFPHEWHPYNMRLWVIGNEFGALGAVWASCEQDALDELVDAGLGEALLVDAADINKEDAEELVYLGNADEPADLMYAWLAPVDLNRLDLPTMLKFAQARGARADNLDQV